MMFGAGILVEITRPTWFDGGHVPAGVAIRVKPLDARALIDSKRARLVNPRDAEKVNAATRAELARTMKREARPWHARSGADAGPWRNAR